MHYSTIQPFHEYWYFFVKVSQNWLKNGRKTWPELDQNQILLTRADTRPELDLITRNPTWSQKKGPDPSLACNVLVTIYYQFFGYSKLHGQEYLSLFPVNVGILIATKVLSGKSNLVQWSEMIFLSSKVNSFKQNGTCSIFCFPRLMHGPVVAGVVNSVVVGVVYLYMFKKWSWQIE